MHVKLALAQICSPKGDWEGNLARASDLMARAREQGCDMIVFPEMGLSGYCDPAKFPGAVVPLDSPFVQRFVELTRLHGIAASGGFIEQNPPGKPFITQVVARNGEMLAVYRKIHVVDEEAEWFSPGSSTVVFNLPLPAGTLRCGVAVCADSERPDIFADLASKGARVVLHSSAPGLYGRRTDEASWQAGYDWYKGFLAGQLPAYATDNSLYIAVATQTGSTVDEDFPGGSFVFGPDGACLASTPDYKEALLTCDIAVESG